MTQVMHVYMINANIQMLSCSPFAHHPQLHSPPEVTVLMNLVLILPDLPV